MRVKSVCAVSGACDRQTQSIVVTCNAILGITRQRLHISLSKNDSTLPHLPYSIFANEYNVSGQRRKLEKSDKGVNEAKMYEKRSRHFIAIREEEFLWVRDCTCSQRSLKAHLPIVKWRRHLFQRIMLD